MKKHGMTASSEYQAYRHAKARCTRPNHRAWKNYGGRGIQFLYSSFEEFYADLGPRPPGCSLDRVDNDGPYSPGRCKWATRTEQNSNTRRNRRLTAFGQTKTVAQWARERSIHAATIFFRLERGWSVEKTLTAPLAVGRPRQISRRLDLNSPMAGTP